MVLVLVYCYVTRANISIDGCFQKCVSKSLYKHRKSMTKTNVDLIEIEAPGEGFFVYKCIVQAFAFGG